MEVDPHWPNGSKQTLVVATTRGSGEGNSKIKNKKGIIYRKQTKANMNTAWEAWEALAYSGLAEKLTGHWSQVGEWL